MIVFEHPAYGTMPVTCMLDVDDEETDDITMACKVVCPMPNGEWLAVCACPNCGKLREIAMRMQ